jgi:hypothetical protein
VFDVTNGIVSALYWIVPRYLDSDLQKEVFETASLNSPGAGLNTSNIAVSGGWDVLYWAAYGVLLIALLYWVLRRREV